jgi:hypothetical protein
MTNVSQTQANTFLELPIVSIRRYGEWTCLNVSRFKSNYSRHIRTIEPSLRRSTPCQCRHAPGHVTLFPSKAIGAMMTAPLWPQRSRCFGGMTLWNAWQTFLEIRHSGTHWLMLQNESMPMTQAHSESTHRCGLRTGGGICRYVMVNPV